MISALGRALWNFLYLEEVVVAILWESDEMELDDARAMMAGQKQQALQTLHRRLTSEGANQQVLDALQAGIDAFGRAREEHRNALSHATLGTVGYDRDRTYLPGMGLTSKLTGPRSIEEAADLHQEAHRIEDALDPLGDAHSAVKSHAGK